MTMAAGLAMAGMHPVVSVYATFLNRAFDQLLMDVALHKLPVTVTLDRAGVTGPDGASHNGMWDGSILQVVPGLRVAAPRDGSRVAELVNEAVEVSDGPTVVRWPKGAVGVEAEAVGKLGGMDVLAEPGRRAGPRRAAAGGRPDGGHLRRGRPAAERPRHRRDRGRPALGHAGGRRRSSPPRGQHRLVAVVEDNGRSGGFGDAVARLLRDADVDTPVKTYGLNQEFLAHASRGEILEAAGLTPQHLARKLTEAVARRTPAAADPAVIACEGTVIDAGAASRVTWASCSELP